MRSIYTSLLIVLTSAALVAQTDKKSKKPAPPPKPVAISGCVSRTSNSTGYAIEDETGTYRLSGLDIHDFLGQKVQVLGGIVETKKLKIAGGLRPSANVAGQAGAIDPVQAATAAAGGSAPTGDVELPEFRVRSVKPLGAGCE